MTFLSPNKFTSGSRPELPKVIRASRAILWVQGLCLLVAGGLQISGLFRLRGMSSAELQKLTKDSAAPWTSQSDIPYGSMWVTAITITVLGLALALLGWRLTTRTQPIRLTTIVVEVIVVLLALISLPTGSCFVVFGLPGIIVAALLLRGPGKEWFAQAGGEPTVVDGRVAPAVPDRETKPSSTKETGSAAEDDDPGSSTVERPKRD